MNYFSIHKNFINVLSVFAFLQNYKELIVLYNAAVSKNTSHR